MQQVPYGWEGLPTPQLCFRRPGYSLKHERAVRHLIPGRHLDIQCGGLCGTQDGAVDPEAIGHRLHIPTSVHLPLILNVADAGGIAASHTTALLCDVQRIRPSAPSLAQCNMACVW